MKGRSLLLTATLILVAGIVLIITYQTTRTTGIVIAGGVLFILVGLLNIFIFMSEKGAAIRALDSERSKGVAGNVASGLSEAAARQNHVDTAATPAGYGHMATLLAWVTSGGAVALGLCMLIFTNVFSGLVPTVFAALILLGALFQFYLLAYGSRPLRLPVWLFGIPVALLGVSVYIYLQHAGDDLQEQHVMLATGITFVVYGLVMYIESALMGYGHRQLAKAASQAAEPKAETKPIGQPDKPSEV